MTTEHNKKHNKIGTDNTGVPEFERNQPGPEDDIERMGRNVVNAFTVERDTDLADGAGAPGGTDVGGSKSRDRR
jgi:hypothetical protein